MARAVRAEPEVTALRWPLFAELFKRTHRQGEHVAIVGQTGSGKTVLGLELCKLIGSRTGRDRRPARVVVLAVKPQDETMRKLGWPIIKEWPPAYGQEHAIVWPKGGAPSDRARRLRSVYRPLLDTIYHEGGQTIYIDEAAYFERPIPYGLGLAGTMEDLWTTGRSLKLTLVAGTQRPRRVSRSMWSEPSWVFVFPPDDLDDLKRVAELTGRRDDVLTIADRLGGFECLVVRRQRAGARALYVTRVGQ